MFVFRAANSVPEYSKCLRAWTIALPTPNRWDKGARTTTSSIQEALRLVFDSCCRAVPSFPASFMYPS